MKSALDAELESIKQATDSFQKFLISNQNKSNRHQIATKAEIEEQKNLEFQFNFINSSKFFGIFIFKQRKLRLRDLSPIT